MRNYKKYLAAILAATMTIGAPAAVMAAGVTPTEYTDPDNATGTINGTGGLEGSLSTDVFKVAVTTIPDDSTFYDFILDPEKLITRSNGAAYSESFVTDKTMYFRNVNDKTDSKDYSDRSDYVTITNKGTMPVDATITAEVDGLGTAIKLAENKTFTDDKDASIYMELVDGAATPKTAAITADGASLTTTIAASSTPNLWKTEYNATTHKYEYNVNTAVTATYNDYKFALSGASNPNGDWSAVGAVAPTVEVVWTVVPFVARIPSIANRTYTMTAGSPVEVAVDLGSGDKAATNVTITYSVSSGDRTLDKSSYTLKDGKLTFTSAYIDTMLNAGVSSRVMKVTFNDPAKTVINVTLNS